MVKQTFQIFTTGLDDILCRCRGKVTRRTIVVAELEWMNDQVAYEYLNTRITVYTLRLPIHVVCLRPRLLFHSYPGDGNGLREARTRPGDSVRPTRALQWRRLAFTFSLDREVIASSTEPRHCPGIGRHKD